MTEVRPYNNEEQIDKSGMNTSLNLNNYATKKTIAQGMLDIALLTANASQLKYVLQAGHKHPFYILMLALIGTSIVLQIFSGLVALTLNTFHDCRVYLLKAGDTAVYFTQFQLASSFIVTTLNVLISAFDPSLGSPVSGFTE